MRVPFPVVQSVPLGYVFWLNCVRYTDAPLRTAGDTGDSSGLIHGIKSHAPIALVVWSMNPVAISPPPSFWIKAVDMLDPNIGVIASPACIVPKETVPGW